MNYLRPLKPAVCWPVWWPSVPPRSGMQAVEGPEHECTEHGVEVASLDLSAAGYTETTELRSCASSPIGSRHYPASRRSR